MKSYYLWMALMPLIYLPNFITTQTAYGMLETGDYLILPLLFLLITDPTRKRKYINTDVIIRLGIAFTAWSIIGIALIYFTYDYTNPDSIVKFSSLKLAKFLLYSFTPLYMSRVLSTNTIRRDFDWAILACALVVGISCILSSERPQEVGQATASYYKALNLVSNVLAIFITYLLGLFVTGYGSPLWRKACLLSLLFIIVGFSTTRGRGGWVAAFCGIIYLAYRRGLMRKRVLIGIIVTFSMSTFLYFQNKEFQFQVDNIFWPDRTFVQTTGYTINDGYRTQTWSHEAAKIVNAPIFGTGFHHRGGLSGLWSSGSHNFWLQIFLETGLGGGIIMMAIFLYLRKHASSEEAKAAGLSLPLKTALYTGFIGGLTGEYFFGGLCLFALLLVYAPVGALRPEIKAHATKYNAVDTPPNDLVPVAQYERT